MKFISLGGAFITTIFLSNVFTSDLLDISDDQKAAMLTSALPLIYIKDQITACQNEKDPVGNSTCAPLILDPMASCCFATMSNSTTTINRCFAIPSDSPSLYNDTLARQGYTIDCDLINSFKGNLTFTTPLNDDDAYTVLVANNLLNQIPEPVKTCRAIQKPMAYEDCKAAIDHDLAQCCYMSGIDSDGRNAQTCEAIPNASENLLGGLYGLIEIEMTCGARYLQSSVMFTLMNVILLLIFV
jgi:hypothetical protein